MCAGVAFLIDFAIESEIKKIKKILNYRNRPKKQKRIFWYISFIFLFLKLMRSLSRRFTVLTSSLSRRFTKPKKNLKQVQTMQKSKQI